METTSRKQPCHCCKGSGVEEDDVLFGSIIRKVRLEKGVTQRRAAKLLGISHVYLCQLEKGRRRWSPDLVDRAMSCAPLWGTDL